MWVAMEVTDGFGRAKAGAGVVLPGEEKSAGVTKGSRRNAREDAELGERVTELGAGSRWQKWWPPERAIILLQ